MPESLLPCAAHSSSTIGGPSQASSEASPCARRQGINALSDDVLVDIFHIYVNNWTITASGWHTLVHVCQRWRYIVFASPRRLNLRIEYTGKGPMSDMLDVWPALPVVISRDLTTHQFSKSYVDSCWGNVSVALESEHHHRICAIELFLIPTSHWEMLTVAMQKPFPQLTYLQFWVENNAVTSLPASFLGGSAPLLQILSLRNCPFPGIPTLLLSASQLVMLDLWNIPDSGFFSPQDLVAALSVMSTLETLGLQFQSPQYPATRPPPSLARSVVPALAHLMYQGVHEYLEDLLTQIEAPFLKRLVITFFMDLDFVVPQLHQLISHAKSFKTCDRAVVRTSDRAIRFAVLRGTNQSPDLSLEISCRALYWQLASLAQVCSSSLPLLSTLVQLDIVVGVPQPHWKDDMEVTQWLQLLDPFTAVNDLRLSDQVARHVFQALEELAEERVTEVLPALQNVFLSGLQPSEPVPAYMERVVAQRQLSGHPVAVYPLGDRRNYSST